MTNIIFFFNFHLPQNKVVFSDFYIKMRNHPISLPKKIGDFNALKICNTGSIHYEIDS